MPNWRHISNYGGWKIPNVKKILLKTLLTTKQSLVRKNT